MWWRFERDAFVSAARGGEARRTARGVGIAMGIGRAMGRAGTRSWLSFWGMMGHFLVVVAWAGGCPNE